MAQFQAGYLLESVRENLLDYCKLSNKQEHLNGLLRSLSTFNVKTDASLEFNGEIPSILAVAINIVTRGLPTIATINIERDFASALNCTSEVLEADKGKISYPWIDNCQTDFQQKLFEALHPIDPRANNRQVYLNDANLDSNFERSFLYEFLPDAHSYLAQILESQRSRGALARNNNIGRVDFSLEIPYHLTRGRNNRFNNLVQTKHQKTYVVEVDGARYHTDLIDDIKDFEIAQFSTAIRHITEDNVFADTRQFVDEIINDNYVKVIKDNFEKRDFLSDPITAIVLSPFAVARLQRVFLQYISANFTSVSDVEIFKVAVLERDLPCAYIAFKDVLSLIGTLNALSMTPITLPNFQIEVFGTDDFINHPLHLGKEVQSISHLNHNDFDLVIDVSILRREGVFKEIEDFGDQVITVRSSHYIHYKTTTGVVSSRLISYKPIVTQLPNEVFEPIEETSVLLTNLLRNIFRKLEFRDGQLPILNRALQLKSVIGLLPTGGGKSLTYQLAAMLQPGTTIVIDPIRSLMIDQYNGLKEMGIDKCEFINSTLTTAERKYNQHNLLAKGQLQMVFVSPERFVIDEFRKALDNAANEGFYFAYAVIDEVHCVSEWGHDFRTPYLNLGDNAQEFCKTLTGNIISLFGLTATASFDVLADIERELNILEDDGNAVVRFENSVRDEINYIVQEVSAAFDGVANITSAKAREEIGTKKQEAIFDIISNKDIVLQQFNNEAVINDIAEHSFKNYLSYIKRQKLIEMQINEDAALHQFKLITQKRLKTDAPFDSFEVHDRKKFDYGLIVFTPHRQGWLGIRNGLTSHGVFDNPNFINVVPQQDERIHYYGNETLGYFMGSGDDENSARIDAESFRHLDRFKSNEESIMVATKAFGMGIDKSNVRMTIHINIPQSIESFVQEAGRAGRDGKIATSIILYNNDFPSLTERPDETFHLDKDVLMFFHKNSFKGQIKERVMIYELRNNITFPNTKNIHLLTEQINQLFGTDEVQFKVNVGRINHDDRIFINTVEGTGVGFVHLFTQASGIYHGIGDDAFCHDMVTHLKHQLPFDTCTEVDQMRAWMERTVVNQTAQTGIENILADMNVGESKSLPIPFINKYYSDKPKQKQYFVINQFHLTKILGTGFIKTILEVNEGFTARLNQIIQNAVYDGLDFSEFLEKLNITFEHVGGANDGESILQLQRAYYLPRSQEDTAKAIYRLISIGIIDSYTIDYQNKLYTITFTKKDEKQYYKSLEKLVSRYTSKNVAKRQIQSLKADSSIKIKKREATIISVCLEFLTSFIYSKIKEKRLQAIDDMIRLCQASVKIADPLEQNKYVKDEIYYYFNAKYSRRGFIEYTQKGELTASLPDDLDDEISISASINKYIELVENEDTGEFISNVKHLRGSSMRMLRSYPGHPQFRILKSFSLFMLGDTVYDLIDEAKQELVSGLIDWKQNEDKDLDIIHFIIFFRERVRLHILNYDVDLAFEDIEDHYYTLYYATWTNNFTTKFLA